MYGNISRKATLIFQCNISFDAFLHNFQINNDIMPHFCKTEAWESSNRVLEPLLARDRGDTVETFVNDVTHARKKVPEFVISFSSRKGRARFLPKFAHLLLKRYSLTSTISCINFFFFFLFSKIRK